MMMMMQYRDCRLNDVNKWQEIDSKYMKSHSTYYYYTEPLLLKRIKLNFLNFKLIFEESFYSFFLFSVYCLYNAREMQFDCASEKSMLRNKTQLSNTKGKNHRLTIFYE